MLLDIKTKQMQEALGALKICLYMHLLNCFNVFRGRKRQHAVSAFVDRVGQRQGTNGGVALQNEAALAAIRRAAAEESRAVAAALDEARRRAEVPALPSFLGLL